MNKSRLTYFDFAGSRGEECRIALHLAGIDFDDMRVQTKGEFGGLGIEVGMEEGFVKVVSPIEDTPAFRAGIKAGDMIIKLDDLNVKGMTLNDAVKKGGSMASSYVGGLSGAFIPLSEDEEMARCAGTGALSLDKLEAMTCVCPVGLDIIALPGDTPAQTHAGIVADGGRRYIVAVLTSLGRRYAPHERCATTWRLPALGAAIDTLLAAGAD